MFGRGFLLSTFIVAVVFASTVYSWKKECQNDFCKEWDDQGNLVKCTRNGAEIPCDSSSPSFPAAGGHQKPSELKREKRDVVECRTLDVEVPCPKDRTEFARTGFPYTKEECENFPADVKEKIRKLEEQRLQQCPPGSKGISPGSNDAEKIGYGLGLMIPSLFAYLFLH